MLKGLAEVPATGPAQARRGRVDVELLGQDVRAEPPAGPPLELEHGPVPQHSLLLLAAQHEPGTPDPLRTAPLDAPASGHPEVAPHHDPTLEAQEQILALRVHRLEQAAVDVLRDPGRLRTRVRRLDLELLPDEHLQPLGRASQRVAFRHDRNLDSVGMEREA